MINMVKDEALELFSDLPSIYAIHRSVQKIALEDLRAGFLDVRQEALVATS